VLSPRAETILKTIIEHYISDAVPVPSQSITHGYGLDVSSATIRSEMAFLKREGYIIQPHTSAGSIPSDKGYRYYVETLNSLHLPVSQQLMISHLFHQVESRLEEWTGLTANILANMVQNMAVVVTARANNIALKHFELVSLQDTTVLMVLVLQSAKLRQQLISFDRTISQTELSTISDKLNKNLHGLTFIQIQDNKLILSDMEKRIIDVILSMMKNEDTAEYESPYLDGLQFFFNQPEFANSRQAVSLLDLVEHKKLMRVILPHGLSRWGVNVFIGNENESEEVRGLSIIVSQYGLPGEAVGCIAVLGPTRMPYARSIASVDFLTEVLTKLMARLYGKGLSPEAEPQN
jgi:heat-inducible transcriptional repressor